MKYLMYITILLLLLQIYLYWDKTLRINSLLSRIYSYETVFSNFKKELKYFKENLNYEHDYFTKLSHQKFKKGKFGFETDVEKLNELILQTKTDMEHVSNTVSELVNMMQIENVYPLDSPTRKIYENIVKFQKIIRVS